MDDLHRPSVASGPTSGPTSNETNKQESLQELIARKENIEAELTALGSVLDSHNVNMNTALTTFDGYPRADIDVAQIRTTRARIVRLKNDHKALMAKLDVVVQEAFAKGAQQSSSAAVPSTSEAQPTRSLATPVPTMEAPFAKVNTVVPNSPAESAGLKAGDRITKFGSANFTNHERLAKVAQVVQQSENVSLRQP